MTPQIATVIGIIVIMSLSFLLEWLPLGFTALMVPVLLQGSGTLTGKEAWSGFSNPTVITWIGLFIIGSVFAKTSYTYSIRDFIKKNTNGSPAKVLAMLFVGLGIIGLMSTGTATIAAMTPIIREICQDSDMDEKRVFKSLADVITWLTVQCLPIGASLSYLLLFNDYLEKAGSTVRYGLMDFTWIKLPMWIVLVVYYLLISKRFKKTAVSEETTEASSQKTDAASQARQRYTPFKEKAAAFIFVGNMIMMILASTTKFAPVYLVSTTFASLAVGLKLITQKEALNAVNWSVIFLVAGTLPLSAAITKSGTGVWLSKVIVQAFPSLTNPIILASAFCIIGMLITQFMSNVAVWAIFSPIAASMAINLGADPRLVVAGVACGAIICFGTPMAGTAEGLIYGVCSFRMKEFIKIGWFPCLLMILTFTIWAPFILNFLYNSNFAGK